MITEIIHLIYAIHPQPQSFHNLKYLIGWLTKIIHEIGNLYITWLKPIWKQLFSQLDKIPGIGLNTTIFYFPLQTHPCYFMLNNCQSFKSWKFILLRKSLFRSNPVSGTYYQLHHNWTLTYPRYYFDWFENQTQQDFQNGQ